MSAKALSRWIIAGTLLVAGACAPVSHAAVGGLSNSFASPLSPAAASPEKTLTFGFDVIGERYLNSVAIGDLAFDGMRGLSTLDPDISVFRIDAQHIGLRQGTRQVAAYAAPGSDAPSADWSALVMTVARDAAAASPKIAKLGNEKILEAVFDATLAKLDRFSRYAGPTEAGEHRAARNGFGGIGVRYEPHPDDITLTEVMPDTPAAAKGLQVGDHILQIDGTSVVGLNQDDISRLMRGAVGSPVALTLRRRDDTQTASLVLNRALIVPPTVSMTMGEDGIATIAITSFNMTTAKLATQALVKAKAHPGFRGVALDLRGNPGGLLDQGVAVADLFMDHGRIVSTRGRHPATLQIYDAKAGDPGEDVPLVVLVDGKSASASEIVTSALEDSGRAVVVGTNSYGKGTVQTVIRLPNDGEMTLTWSRYYSPAGYALHGLGVLPSICTADEHAPPTALLKAALDGQTAVATDIVSWRASPVDAEAERNQLRTHCPSAKHADNATDTALAHTLLKDPTLYRRALALTAPTAALATTAAATAHAVPDIAQH